MLRFFPRPTGEPDTFFMLAQLLFTDPADVPALLGSLHRRFCGGIVIAFVQTQILWLLLRTFGLLYHHGFEGSSNFMSGTFQMVGMGFFFSSANPWAAHKFNTLQGF